MCDVSVPKTVPEVCHHPCRFQSSLVSQASKPGYHAIVIHVGTPRKGTITSITSMACVFLHFAFLTEGDDVDRGETRHYCTGPRSPGGICDQAVQLVRDGSEMRG